MSVARISSLVITDIGQLTCSSSALIVAADPSNVVSGATISLRVSGVERASLSTSGLSVTGGGGFSQKSFVGASAVSTSAFFLSGNTSSQLGQSGATKFGFASNLIVDSGTSTLYADYNSAPSTEAASFTLTSLANYYAGGGALGAGSAITTHTCFDAVSVFTAAGTGYGFRGRIASGTNRYNLYMDGTAQNYLAGVILGGNGAVGAPEFSFNSDTDTGIYRIGANNLGIAAGGTKILDVGSGGLAVTGAVAASDAIVAANALISTSGITTNAANRTSVDWTSSTSTGRVLVWGPNAATAGTLDLGVLSSDASVLALSVLRVTSTGAAITGTLSVSGVTTVASSTATPAGGSTSARLLMGTTSGFGIYYGSGAPTVSAGQGSVYLCSDGSSTSTRMYINTNGSTTWTAVTTVA